MRLKRNTIRIISTAMTPLNPTGKPKPSELMMQAINSALNNVGLQVKDVDGLVCVPSLAQPHFMEATYIATKIGLVPKKDVVLRTIDTGGAGPITALIQAARMVKEEGCQLVVVGASDAVRSLPDFLKRADLTCNDEDKPRPSPVIPLGYNRVAEWQMQQFGVTRRQLASCSALMSIMASRHPQALTKKPRSIQEVLNSPKIGSVTNLLECARRADGGAAILVASDRFVDQIGLEKRKTIEYISGAEASGPIYPPDVITDDLFSCENAMKRAYFDAHLGPEDIDFFGLYDCFPICLIRAVEAAGLAPRGQGGSWIEEKYEKILASLEAGTIDVVGSRPQDIVPLNTHGGLLCFGAPWETPAMFNIIEAFAQLTGQAGNRQVNDCRRALVYGNGGIFSASSVAILGRGRY